MPGIILSLLAALAVLIFAFHSNDACDHTGRRSFTSTYSKKSDVVQNSAGKSSKAQKS